MKSSVKVLIMTIVAIIASAISTKGIPTDLVSWEVLGITILGSILVYVGKNFFYPSTSPIGTIDGKDLISGLIIAIGTGLSDFIAHGITGTSVNFSQLATFVITVIIGYLSKNLASGVATLSTDTTTTTTTLK